MIFSQDDTAKIQSYEQVVDEIDWSWRINDISWSNILDMYSSSMQIAQYTYSGVQKSNLHRESQLIQLNSYLIARNQI